MDLNLTNFVKVAFCGREELASSQCSSPYPGCPSCPQETPLPCTTLPAAPPQLYVPPDFYAHVGGCITIATQVHDDVITAQKRYITIAFQGSPFHCRRAVECTFVASPLPSAAADKRVGLKSRDQLHALHMRRCVAKFKLQYAYLCRAASSVTRRYIPALP